MEPETFCLLAHGFPAPADFSDKDVHPASRSGEKDRGEYRQAAGSFDKAHAKLRGNVSQIGVRVGMN